MKQLETEVNLATKILQIATRDQSSIGNEFRLGRATLILSRRKLIAAGANTGSQDKE
jgi:hypothetical protein